MSERKVLNKYYPPDFDPSKIPRMKLPKNRQYTVRLMAPFNMRCKTCGEYIYKGKKFNARKEDVENQDYLGIRIYRFYIKCTRCLQEISFKTDPRNCDYEIEAGATRNFMALKLAEEQAQREEDELREEEANNPMKLLENRTIQSKNEIELLESLEELKDLNKRHQTVDYDSMLQAYDTRLSAREIEERLRQRDEEYLKTVKFQSSQKRKVVVEEEIVDAEVENKQIKIEEIEIKTEPDEVDPLIESAVTTSISTEKPTPIVVSKSNTNSWNRSVGVMSRKNALSGLVRIKKPATETVTVSDKEKNEKVDEIDNKKVNEETKTLPQSTSGLSLLGNYSGSDSNDSD